jgi:hypothetical protein
MERIVELGVELLSIEAVDGPAAHPMLGVRNPS